MGVFSNTQGQLTLQSVVKSCRISNSSEILWLSSIRVRIKKIGSTSSPNGNDAHLRAIIQSEEKWKHQFFRRLRAANSVVHGRIWPNFKLIQALMYVIITCKYEKDPIKNNREKVATQFFKLYHYLLPWKPVVESGRISHSSKLLCMSSLPASMKRIR